MLHPDLKEFIELLNSERVEFVVVGAHALAYYGHPRMTGDLDIFVRVSDENALRLEAVMGEFGFADLGLTARDFMAEQAVIQLGAAPNRIDILTGLTGVTFDEVWAGAIAAKINSIDVRVIGRNEFIKNKRALGRAKDLVDIEAIGEEPES